MDFLRKIDNVLRVIEKVIVGTGVISATLIVFVNVITRYFFSYSFRWVEEASRYIMIWVAFFGGSLAVRYGAHVSVDAINTLLKKPVLRVLFSIIAIAAAAFMTYFGINGVEMVRFVAESGQVSASMEFLPMYVVYLAVPIGSFLMVIQYIKLFFANAFGNKVKMHLEGGN